MDNINEKRRYWTEEEVEYLISHCGKTKLANIAKSLGRSRTAIRTKMYKLGITQRDSMNGMNIREVSEITGIDYTIIKNIWFKNGLKHRRVGKCQMIHESDLIKFMLDNRRLWDARKVDGYFFQKYKWFRQVLEEDRKNNGGLCQTPWTLYERQQLELMRKRGIPFDEIARQLGRTKYSVQSMSYYDRYMRKDYKRVGRT